MKTTRKKFEEGGFYAVIMLILFIASLFGKTEDVFIKGCGDVIEITTNWHDFDMEVVLDDYVVLKSDIDMPPLPSRFIIERATVIPIDGSFCETILIRYRTKWWWKQITPEIKQILSIKN